MVFNVTVRRSRERWGGEGWPRSVLPMFLSSSSKSHHVRVFLGGLSVTLVGPGFLLPLTPSTTVSLNPAEALAALSLCRYSGNRYRDGETCVVPRRKNTKRFHRNKNTHTLTRNRKKTLFFRNQASKNILTLTVPTEKSPTTPLASGPTVLPRLPDTRPRSGMEASSPGAGSGPK